MVVFFRPAIYNHVADDGDERGWTVASSLNDNNDDDASWKVPEETASRPLPNVKIGKFCSSRPCRCGCPRRGRELSSDVRRKACPPYDDDL